MLCLLGKVVGQRAGSNELNDFFSVFIDRGGVEEVLALNAPLGINVSSEDRGERRVDALSGQSLPGTIKFDLIDESLQRNNKA